MYLCQLPPQESRRVSNLVTAGIGRRISCSVTSWQLMHSGVSSGTHYPVSARHLLQNRPGRQPQNERVSLRGPYTAQSSHRRSGATRRVVLMSFAPASGLSCTPSRSSKGMLVSSRSDVSDPAAPLLLFPEQVVEGGTAEIASSPASSPLETFSGGPSSPASS